MRAISRLFTSAGVLVFGGLLGVGASSAQARVDRSWGPAYPSRVVASRRPAYLRAPWTYEWPAPTFARPARIDSYRYFDSEGVEYDSRYPHWSYNSRMSYP